MRRGDRGGTIARRRASFDKGIELCEKSLQLFDPKTSSGCGVASFDIGTIEKAKDVMTEAVTCLRKGVGDPKELVYASDMLSLQYGFLGEPIKALEIRAEAVALATAVPSVWREEGWENRIAKLEVCLAYSLWELGRYTEAERLFGMVLQKGRRGQGGYLCDLQHSCAVQLAKMALYRRQYARALDLLVEADRAVSTASGREEFIEDEHLVEVLTMRGNVYEALGDTVEMMPCNAAAMQLIPKYKTPDLRTSMLVKGVDSLRRTGEYFWTCGELTLAETCLNRIRGLFRGVCMRADIHRVAMMYVGVRVCMYASKVECNVLIYHVCMVELMYLSIYVCV